MEIFLKPKEVNTFVALPCPLCRGLVGDGWLGIPVVACTGTGAVVCRQCVEDGSPLLLALADLAHTASIMRPDLDNPALVLDASRAFRERVFDRLQVERVAFDLESLSNNAPRQD